MKAAVILFLDQMLALLRRDDLGEAENVIGFAPRFEDVEFECTRCCEVEVFPFESVYKMRAGGKKSVGVCRGCGMVLMKERLQLGAFARDVEQWLKSES